jgi:hypothetical protein
MNRSERSFASRFKLFVVRIGLLSLLSFSCPSLAGMIWSARAIHPALIGELKNDSKLLDQMSSGNQPEIFTEKQKKECRVDLSNKQVRDEGSKCEPGNPQAP